MEVDEVIRHELAELAAVSDRTGRECCRIIASFVDLYASVLRGGGRLFFLGNGGSAADAQHLASEYVVRLGRHRASLPAVALTTDSSILTACGNDFSFDEVFSRQVEALCGPGDLLVIHSTSGNSENLCLATEVAKAKGVVVAALLGKDGGKIKEIADHSIVVPSDETSHIQEMHIAIEHIICRLVEDRVVPEGADGA